MRVRLSDAMVDARALKRPEPPMTTEDLVVIARRDIQVRQREIGPYALGKRVEAVAAANRREDRYALRVALADLVAAAECWSDREYRDIMRTRIQGGDPQ